MTSAKLAESLENVLKSMEPLLSSFFFVKNAPSYILLMRFKQTSSREIMDCIMLQEVFSMSSLRLLSDKSLLFAYRHAQRLNLDMEFITMLKQEITERKLIHIVFNKNTKILFNQQNKRES